VELACRDAKIEVGEKEIDADIEATLKKLGMKRQNFIQSVLGRQGITYQQYRRDRVWPKLAMVKLVRPLVKVSDDDIQRGFEATWGPKVECRMLVVGETGRAQDLWEKLAAVKGEERLKMFEDFCKQYSIDSASRPYGGQVAPFNRHSSNPDLEKKIFELKEGELSSIMQIAEGNVIFLCVKHLPAQKEMTLDSVINQITKETARQALHDGIFTKKLQAEADRVFSETKKKARVENFLSGDFSPEALQKIAAPDVGKSQKR
jgi:parvulin-like peptidyl-prolyl isomerase